MSTSQNGAVTSTVLSPLTVCNRLMLAMVALSAPRCSDQVVPPSVVIKGRKFEVLRLIHIRVPLLPLPIDTVHNDSCFAKSFVAAGGA